MPSTASASALPSPSRNSESSIVPSLESCGIVPDIRGLLLIGPPGSGKGTIGQKLENLLGFKHLSSGDLIRAAMSNDGLDDPRWGAVSKGGLICEDDLWQLFDSFVSEWRHVREQAAKPNPLIIDGIPRCPGQVSALARRVSVVGVINLECDNQEILVGRLQARAASLGRIDDLQEHILRERLQLFETETRPVVDAYPNEIVRRIDSSQPLSAVLRDVLKNMLTFSSLQDAIAHEQQFSCCAS